MQQKDYNKLFKAEKESFGIIGYEHKLGDIEEAFVTLHKEK